MAEVDLESEPLIKSFVQHLSDFMDEHQISRSDLAQRLGTSKAYITKVFHGENLSLKTIGKIARALNCKVDLNLR